VINAVWIAKLPDEYIDLEMDAGTALEEGEIMTYDQYLVHFAHGI
jgi:hypothetical protein